MDNYPKISIITPNYNGAEFLEETILSVLGQDYPNLEYIIIDGNSKDRSIEIIKKYEKKLAFWISEPDKGMYDAIQKGFNKSCGEIMGWINSDDILQKKSLFTLADIFSLNHKIQWIQGYPNVIDNLSRLVTHCKPCFSKYSFYLKDYHKGIYIQQESTFWRRELWILSGGSLSEKYKYAGDFELWMRFFRYADLYNTKSLLGSFRVHGPDQVSNAYYSQYISECDEIITEATKKLIPAERRHLFTIQLLRKFRMHTYGLDKILNLTKLENRWLGKPFSIEYDLTTNQFKPN